LYPVRIADVFLISRNIILEAALKGKILGFADASGVISGTDGNRYKFTAADWKAPRAPKIGEEVDFEVSATGGAGEIYPTHPSGGFDLGDVGAKMGDMGAKVKEALGPGGSVDLNDAAAKAKAFVAAGSSSPAGARALKLLTGRLTVPLAIVLVLASFLFSYLTWSGEQLASIGVTTSGSYSVLGISSFSSNVGGFFSTLSKQVSAEAPGMQQQLDAAKQGGATDADTTQMQTALSSLNSAGSDASMVGLAIDLMYLLYLVPLGALFILYREWIGQPMALVSLVVGGLSVFGFLLAYVTQWSANGAIKNFMSGGILGQGGDATNLVASMSVGLGAWILLICGAVLVLHALGIVKFGSQSA
jgi:hypothetical protein